MKILDLTVKFSMLTGAIGAVLEGARAVEDYLSTHFAPSLYAGVILIVAGVAVGVFTLYLIEKQAKE